MILDREQRASDLATKADRDISPKLTDEQYHALLYYTFKAGFKHPAQLLEAFGPTRLHLDRDVTLTVNSVVLTLKQGMQLLDGQRMWQLLLSCTPASPVLQCELLPKLLALCIHQHLSLLSEENSSRLFTAVVNAGSSDLVYSDFDSRRKAADFLSRFCEQPAQIIPFSFVKNPDATLSLSDSAEKELLLCFSAGASEVKE